MPDELRLYDFVARFAAFGFDRKEAMSAVEKAVIEAASAEQRISSSQVVLTNDRNLLARLGVDREGEPARVPPEGQIPGFSPPPLWMQHRERVRRLGTDPDNPERPT
jgi:hypothetical protein